MMKKEFPFKTTFSSVLKPIVSEEKDKYLALASLDEVRAFIPEIGKGNVDLLPVAFNACVVNRVNKNDDVIDTDTALAVYKSFIYKQINIEHNRKNVIGCILAAGFSEFGTDKPLTEEQVKGMKGPFNITLGGVIWRVVDSDLASTIEDSNDPTSPNYLLISASWELGFSSYKVIVLDDNKKNIENAQIVADEEEVNKFRNRLKSTGGDGKTLDDRRVYRLITEDVLPLGIGLTSNPAADVEGVATKEKPAVKAEVEAEVKAETETDINKQNNISQAENSNVNIERIQSMTKITSIKDITDDSLKQTTASAIAEFIAAELSVKSKEWEAEKAELGNTLAKAKEDAQKAVDAQTELQKQFDTLKATVEALQAEKVEAQKVEKFNARMAEVVQAYDLDDEARAAIVEEVKVIASDEDFDKWKKKAAILLKGFAKKAEKVEKDEKAEKCKDCGKQHSGECKAEKDETKASTVVDEALDKAEKEKGGLPNTSSSDKKSLKETFAAAFTYNKNNFEIKY